MKKIKVAVAGIFLASAVAAMAEQALGYPPFVAKSRKFGAKDCTFCHVDPLGGPPWNERGEWLIKEKERRKADAIDPEWLVDYKPEEKKDGEKKDGEKKEGEEKKDSGKPPEGAPR